MADIVLRGSFDISQQRRYVHVPFEVPPGVGALHISYDYSDRISSDPRLHGGNTLDIGLFDPRSKTHTRAIASAVPQHGRMLALIAHRAVSSVRSAQAVPSSRMTSTGHSCTCRG